jgi:multidrug efflux pump subunit AcrB
MIQSLPGRLPPARVRRLRPHARSRPPNRCAHAIFGVEVAEVNEGVRRYALAVRLAEGERDSIEDLRRLVLRGPAGRSCASGEVADIGPRWRPT